ncbi:MAG TPA: S66 peptidase family protein [Candidatus Kapabacteria bacterium]|nr:S66 peptidase family protein [Candidatus Kapabacteria bacterium]
MNHTLIRPRPLQPGATIGIFTPSSPANVWYREKYLHGVRALEVLGFRVVEGSLTARACEQGYRSGTPEERAAEFMELIENSSVDCMMATIGGMNSSSMIPFLDFDVIRAHPKIITGYSDVTSLHLAILAYSGLSTFYGPALVPSFGEWPAPLAETVESFLAATQRHVSGRRRIVPPERWSNHLRDARTDAWRNEDRIFRENPGFRTLNPGSVEAPVIVANLNTMLTAAGTAYFPDVTGAILLIEEMNAPYSLEERSLRHLSLLGVFDRIAGLIIGKPEMPESQGAPFTLDDLVLEVVGRRPYPIVSNFDCSHTHPMLTIAQMTTIALEANGGYDVGVVIGEPMVAM